MTYLTHYRSPLGEITLASDGEALTGLWFDGQKYDRLILREEVCREEALPVFALSEKWLDLYFDGKQPDFTPPLKLSGSDFRKRVGEIMLTIPYGQTRSYGEIARVIAKERGLQMLSAQAVGGAVGHNPISIIVPCHRVVGANGSLTGYAGGVKRKVWLLEKEGIDLAEAGLFVPAKGTAV